MAKTSLHVNQTNFKMSVFDSLKNLFNENCLSYVGIVRGSHAMLLFYIPIELFKVLGATQLFACSEGAKYEVEVIKELGLRNELEQAGESSSGIFVYGKISATELSLSEKIRFFYGNQEVCCADDRYSLSTLIHHRYQAFQAGFSFAARRIVDEETARFIAKNNIVHSKAVSGTIKVTSFSIYVYKSISTGNLNHSEVNEFFNIAKDSVEIFSEEEINSRSIRSDVIGRALSIRLAYCHYLLAYGDINKIKECLLDLFYFYKVAQQPGFKKTKLEDHSYLYFKLLVIGMISSWSIKDYSFYELLKSASIQTYKYVSAVSSDLPYVYLKEYGETYASYLSLVKFIDGGECSDKDFLNAFKSASRVKNESYISDVRRRIFSGGGRLVFYKKFDELAISENWFDIALPRGKFFVMVSAESGGVSKKAAIVAFKNSAYDVRNKKEHIGGLVSSDISSLGMYRYIPYSLKKKSFSFVAEIFCEECINKVSIFKWDKSVYNLREVIFYITEFK